MIGANDVPILQNFIGNQLVQSSNAQVALLDSFNPATGELLYQIPDSCEADVELAVQAAERALASWSETSRAERSKIMMKIADLLESRLDEFAQAESRDQGKPVSLARMVDIPRAVANFRFFASEILHWVEMATGDSSSGIINMTQSVPVGICGLISPWNLPLYLMTWKIAPAIAAGNVVICKPSELTSLTASMFSNVLMEAGLPAGVVNILFGSGKSAGAALVMHPKVKLISFTGGTETGKIIASLAAPHIKKLSLELGGKNANVIFDDADLSKVIPTTVRSSFQNQGEICLCGSRILVQRGIYQEFVDKFLKATEDWTVGDPRDPATKMGALVSKEHYDKVVNYIALAEKEGGKILKGGHRPSHTNPKGNFLEPTIIVGLPHSSSVIQNEIFGPVVTINVFDTEQEAIQMANDVSYGLSASVWTENIGKGNRIARALLVGTVWINCWMVRDLLMPFGGMKQSGIGREGGQCSLDFFTEKKSIATYIRD